LLQQYRGTVFLVSHDRRFVDAVVTSTIVWEGDPAQGGQPGLWREYEGGIEDWILQRDRARAAQAASSVAASAAASAAVSAGPSPGRSGAAAPMASPASSHAASPAASPAVSPPPARRKLGYKEQRELEALPGLIDQLETEQRTIADLLADGSLFSTDRARATALSERSAAIEDELMKALERWEELGSR
jgi:ATP-binding cassette subfamily F protein uup